MKHRTLFAAAAALLLSGTANAALSQAELDTLAEAIDVRFAVLDNSPDKCPDNAPGCFLSEMRIRMPERMPERLGPDEIAIYFSYLSRLAKADSDTFEASFINGDFHVLKPKRGVRLEAGRTYTVRLWGSGHFFSSWYVMPNMYVAADGLSARTIASTRPTLDPETGLERLPFVAAMTNEADLSTASPDDQNRWLTPERAFERYAQRNGAAARPDLVVLPTPLKASRPAGAALDLTRGVRLRLTGADRDDLQAALNRLVAAGVGGLETGPELRIEVSPARDLGAEGYRLTTVPGGIRIRAGGPAGASYALRSLAQQVAYEGGRLRPLAIEDSPRLPFRGLHVDVARNFHSKAELLKIIEQMASYKLNKLHLHLGEDEGWRLEIKALPELTQVGGFRCHDPAEDRCLLPQLGAGAEGTSPGNGYFSQADYLDILAAAKARQIEVIPSFDMPGHSRAAIRSMEARYRRLMAEGKPAEAALYRLVEPEDRTRYSSVQNYTDNTLNVCLESTYRFLDKVLDEVSALHAAAGTPLKTYHIGADETAGAWSDSPTCQALMRSKGLQAKQLGAMFVERVAQGLAKRGVTPAGWSDGLGHTDPAKMPKNVQTNLWANLLTGGVLEAHSQLNHGWRGVMSTPDVVYFDSPYVPHPQERGLDWPSRGTDTFKVFSFMPQNLPANASVMRDLAGAPRTVVDDTPLLPGRRPEGFQAQLWSETIRLDTEVDYMLFPRLLALAERAWHRAPWEPEYKPRESYSFGDGKVDTAAIARDWNSFAARMPAHLAFLDAANVTYRLAPPGARIVNGRLEANTEFPGVAIEYRTGDGGWRRYAGPVSVRGPVEIRARTPDGRRASRTVTLSPR